MPLAFRLLFVSLAAGLLGACADAPAGDAPATGETTVVSGETSAPVPGRAADPPEDALSTSGATGPGAAGPPVTITAMQAGDAACYVTLADASGATRDERAAFELCERADLIGRRVALLTETAQIMAASCEGDPECLDTESVTLIVDATPVR